MKRRIVLAVLFSLAPLPVLHAADYPGALKVTFRTTDCSGATGLASVNVDDITRTLPYVCPDGRKLKQVLAHAPGGASAAYTIAEEEAPKLEAQIQRIMDARQKALQDGKQIIIRH